jgi:hypothetical protein
LPSELQNEAYATIDRRERYDEPFVYHYDIEDMGHDECADLFAEADDRTSNQLRVTGRAPAA